MKRKFIYNLIAIGFSAMLCACGTNAASTGSDVASTGTEEAASAEAAEETASTETAENVSSDESTSDAGEEPLGDTFDGQTEEIFLPNDFLQVRQNNNRFASYDEIISLLEPGEAYTYLQVYGYDGELLAITDDTYEVDGAIVSPAAYLYAQREGFVESAGNIFASEMTYPVKCDGNLICIASEDEYEADFIAKEEQGLMVKDYISRYTEEDGTVGYSGFIRENNTFDDTEEEITNMTDDEFDKFLENYNSMPVLEFTRVE